MAVAGNSGGAGGAKNIARAQRKPRPPSFPKAVPARPGAVTQRSAPRRPRAGPPAAPSPAIREQHAAAAVKRAGYAKRARAVRKVRRQVVTAPPRGLPNFPTAVPSRPGAVTGRPLTMLDTLTRPKGKPARFAADETQIKRQQRHAIDAGVAHLMTKGRAIHKQEATIERLRQLGAAPGDSEFQKAVDRRNARQERLAEQKPKKKDTGILGKKVKVAGVNITPKQVANAVSFALPVAGPLRAIHEAAKATGVEKKGLSTAGAALDQLTRINNAEAGYALAVAKGKGQGEAIKQAGRGFTHKDRHTFSDVFKELGVPKGIREPLGFTADIGLDPTTYATFGVGGVAKGIGAKAATKIAERAAEKKIGERAGEVAGREAARKAERVAARAVKRGRTEAPSGEKWSDWVARQGREAAQKTTATQRRQVAETARRHATAKAKAKVGERRGITLGFAGKEVPGVRRATAAAGVHARRAGARITPTVARRAGKAGREAITEVAPHVRPAAELPPEQFKQVAGAEAKRTARRSEADARATAIGTQLRRAFQQTAHDTGGNADELKAAFIHAIETNDLRHIPEPLHQAARDLDALLTHTRKVGKRSGIAAGARDIGDTRQWLSDTQVGSVAKALDIQRDTAEKLLARRILLEERAHTPAAVARARDLLKAEGASDVAVAERRGELATERARLKGEAETGVAGARGALNTASERLRRLSDTEFERRYGQAATKVAKGNRTPELVAARSARKRAERDLVKARNAERKMAATPVLRRRGAYLHTARVETARQRLADASARERVEAARIKGVPPAEADALHNAIMEREFARTPQAVATERAALEQALGQRGEAVGAQAAPSQREALLAALERQRTVHGTEVRSAERAVTKAEKDLAAAREAEAHGRTAGAVARREEAERELERAQAVHREARERFRHFEREAASSKAIKATETYERAAADTAAAQRSVKALDELPGIRADETHLQYVRRLLGPLGEGHDAGLRALYKHAEDYDLPELKARIVKLMGKRPDEIASRYFPHEYDQRIEETVGRMAGMAQGGHARGRAARTGRVPRITAGFERQDRRTVAAQNAERAERGEVPISTQADLAAFNAYRDINRAAAEGQYAKDLAEIGRPIRNANDLQNLAPGEAVYRLGYKDRQFALHEASDLRQVKFPRTAEALAAGAERRRLLERLKVVSDKIRRDNDAVARTGRPHRADLGSLKAERKEIDKRIAAIEDEHGLENLTRKSPVERGGQYVALHKGIVDHFVARQAGLANQLADESKIAALYDKGLQKFKATAIATLGFHIRNALSDLHLTYQAHPNALTMGRNLYAGMRAARRHAVLATQISPRTEVGARAALAKRTVNVAGKDQPMDEFLRGAQERGVVDSGYIGGELHDMVDTAGAARSADELVDQLPTTRRGMLKTLRHKARAVSAGRENLFKLATYKAMLDKGMSADEAAAVAREFHVDYRNISPLERRFLRRIMPFYTWPARQAALQTKLLFQKPGKAATYTKLTRDIQNALSGMSEEERQQALDPYAQRQGAIIISWHGRPITLSWGDPTAMVSEFPGAQTLASHNPMELGHDLDEMVKFWGTGNPLINSIVGLYTGKNPYTRGPIAESGKGPTDAGPLRAAPSLIGPLSHLLPRQVRDGLGIVPDFRDPKTGRKGWGWNGRADFLWDQLQLGWRGQLAQVLGSGRTPGAPLSQQVGGFVGIGGKPVTPPGKRADQAEREKIGNVQLRLHTLRQRGIDAAHPNAEYRRLRKLVNANQRKAYQKAHPAPKGAIKVPSVTVPKIDVPTVNVPAIPSG